MKFEPAYVRGERFSFHWGNSSRKWNYWDPSMPGTLSPTHRAHGASRLTISKNKQPNNNIYWKSKSTLPFHSNLDLPPLTLAFFCPFRVACVLNFSTINITSLTKCHRPSFGSLTCKISRLFYSIQSFCSCLRLFTKYTRFITNLWTASFLIRISICTGKQRS